MAKYLVKFEIGVIVDEDFEVGEVDDVLYDECGTDKLGDDKWNYLVGDAVDAMEDVENCVTEITRVEDDDEEE